MTHFEHKIRFAALSLSVQMYDINHKFQNVQTDYFIDT